MADEQFDIRILDLHWITEGDDPSDLCAHGHVYVRIADEVVSDRQTGDWTLSSTALSLMRTINQDYKKGDFGNQLIPCCGFFMIADDYEESVTIVGCANGIDWTIIHHAGMVEHLTDQGKRAVISRDTYRNIVFDFADKVEQFYTDSQPKIIPDDDFERKGYLTFWKEWRRLRNGS